MRPASSGSTSWRARSSSAVRTPRALAKRARTRGPPARAPRGTARAICSTPRGPGGRSLSVAPGGEVRAEGEEEGGGVIVADLDCARQDEVRAKLPLLAHRRPAVYDWPTEVRA